MKVVWLCPYSLQYINDKLDVKVDSSKFHPATWLYYLNDEINKHHEIDLHIITLTSYVDKDYTLKENNTTYHIIKHRTPHFGKFVYQLYEHFSEKYNRPLLKNKVIRLINKINPDLVNLHGTEHYYSIYVNKLKIPVLVWIQGVVNFVVKYDGSHYFDSKLLNENVIFERQKYFITVPGNMQDLISQKNINARFFNLYYPISHYAFDLYDKNVPKDNDIVFVGEIIKRKGIEDLIMAVKIIKSNFKSIKVKVIGTPRQPYMNFVNQMIIDNDLAENINIVGMIPSHDDVMLEVKKSKVFMLPTYVDTGPRSVAESMAIGTPVISYNVDGLPGMIKNGANGILVEKGNINHLAESAISLLKDEQRMSIISAEANKSARENYYAPTIVNKLIGVYKNIILEEKNRN